MYEMSPCGSQPSTQPTSLGRGRLEAQLAHRRDEICLLDGFREVCGEELLALRHLHSAVCTNSNYWCRRVLIVGTFNIPCGALAINCGWSISACQGSEEQADVRMGMCKSMRIQSNSAKFGG